MSYIFWDKYKIKIKLLILMIEIYIIILIIHNILSSTLNRKQKVKTRCLGKHFRLKQTSLY